MALTSFRDLAGMGGGSLLMLAGVGLFFFLIVFLRRQLNSGGELGHDFFP